jgi:hypothetical protein
MQAEYGDSNADRHKPGFMDDLNALLPVEYTKTKNAEKTVYAVHRKLLQMTRTDAKIRFVKLTRSLKTYGITFFSVKENEAGKRKPIGRLLGISPEAVFRLDEVTKEFLKTWPLTNVRRWAGSATNFVLDFGGFDETYLNVQTDQGQVMSQLLADYIDVVLNQKKQEDRRAVAPAARRNVRDLRISSKYSYLITSFRAFLPQNFRKDPQLTRLYPRFLNGAAVPPLHRPYWIVAVLSLRRLFSNAVALFLCLLALSARTP